jgi:outer membrane beta-barrel protein
MTVRRPVAALVLLALIAAAAAPGSARAQTRADAFAGRIPPISGQLYRKSGRLELSVTGNLSLADAFFSKRFGGAKLGYHFAESVSLAVHGMAGSSVASGSAVLCTRSDGCGAAEQAMLFQVPGQIRWIAGAEVAWAPVYGKLNVVAEKVAHFDLSILAGVDAIAHDQILSGRPPASGGESPAEELAASGGTPPVERAIGGHVGLGARIFLAEWMAARLEIKDYIYSVNVPNAGSGGDVQHQFFTELGLSFFLPTHNRAR